METHIFKTTDSTLKHRNGQKTRIVRHITEPEDGFDAEVLPMVEVRFGDGFQTEVWPDELTKYEYGGPSYRDTL